MFNIIKKLLNIYFFFREKAADNALFYLREDLKSRRALLGMMFLPFLSGLPVPPLTVLSLLPFAENEIITALKRYSPDPDSFSFLGPITDGVL